MSNRLLAHRFRAGRYLGIDLFIHWTFLLLAAYVFLSSLGEGVWVASFMLAQLFGAFFCVTLHEYGHAMAARYFGIGTADITLLPIGGVARLHRMPRIPWQEMVVAIAGPAVNIVLVLGLAFVFATQVNEEVLIGLRDLAANPQEGMEISQDVATAIDTMFRFPSIAGYLFTMIVVNVMLVIFNLIPAFPMDGGRVLRSFVAMFTSYTRATRFAFRVGVFCAVMMILAALQGGSSNPIPVFIGLFVAFAGYSEYKQVEVNEAVRGRTVGEAMIYTKNFVEQDLAVRDLALRWKKLSTRSLPVLHATGKPVGIIKLSDLSKHELINDGDRQSVASLLDMSAPIKTVSRDEPLDQALLRLDRRVRQHLVVDASGLFLGILDLDTMLDRLRLPECSPTEEDSKYFDGN